MAARAGEGESAEWARFVTVRALPELRGELLGRLARTGPMRPIGVTDLIALRRAYWRATSAPLEIPPERRGRIDLGRWIHRHLGEILGPETALEVRVRGAGCVGRIDGLTEVPIEVKTGSTIVEPAQLRDARPDQIEQLAMYCALTRRVPGRLVSIVLEDREVRTCDVGVREPAAVVTEMIARGEALRSALGTEDPARLPRCRWFDRGCEFQQAGRCDCSGREDDPPSRILEEVGPIVPRPDIDREISERLHRLVGVSPPPSLERFRDLLYPRRAYFERASPELAKPFPAPSAIEAPDLYARIAEAVESGPLGDVARLPPRAPEPEEDVTGFRGDPLLLRTSRAWDPIAPEDLVRRAPQYALELGYRCAVTGRQSGVLLLGYERAESDSDRLEALEVRFTSITPFARRVREGSEELARALLERRPSELPACPAWMVADCPYAAECGCGAPPPRSQR